jgi:hypothetical protein
LCCRWRAARHDCSGISCVPSPSDSDDGHDHHDEEDEDEVGSSASFYLSESVSYSSEMWKAGELKVLIIVAGGW